MSSIWRSTVDWFQNLPTPPSLTSERDVTLHAGVDMMDASVPFGGRTNPDIRPIIVQPTDRDATMDQDLLVDRDFRTDRDFREPDAAMDYDQGRRTGATDRDFTPRGDPQTDRQYTSQLMWNPGPTDNHRNND